MDSAAQPKNTEKPSSSAVTVIGKLKSRQKAVGFQVMVGAAQQLEPSLALGAVGGILAFACPAPMACYEIYAAFKDGNTALAREKQDRLKLAAQRVVGDCTYYPTTGVTHCLLDGLVNTHQQHSRRY